MTLPGPQQEHAWLRQLLGEWTIETEASPEPGEPPQTYRGTESVRSLGGFWVVAEGQGEMPGGIVGTTIMTLGFDPLRGRYVGTWVGSMMANLWLYEGELDTTGRVLTLQSEGPSMTDLNATALYRDVIEITSPDERVMTAQMRLPDGSWQSFMTARYRRVR